MEPFFVIFESWPNYSHTFEKKCQKPKITTLLKGQKAKTSTRKNKTILSRDVSLNTIFDAWYCSMKKFEIDSSKCHEIEKRNILYNF